MPAYGISREQSVDLIVKTALEYGITDERQIAYMLASAQHETDDFRTSREDDGPRQALRLGYGGGENYYGRGYVQVTHDRNYARMDAALGLGGRLSANPELAATDANIGAQTLVVGMVRGLYTGVGIHRYVGGDRADYEEARRTVNGTDRADVIADYARAWEGQVHDIVDRVGRDGIVHRPLPGGPMGADGELRPGANGIEVQYAQAALDRLGFRDDDGDRLVPDGDLGNRTQQAVRAFQQSRGLDASGTLDQATIEALGLRQFLRAPEPQSETRQPGLDPAHTEPLDARHSESRLLQRMQQGVTALDREVGKGWDQSSERLCASLFARATEQSFGPGDELSFAFNKPTPSMAGGQIVHVFRHGGGASVDPAANRIAVDVADALATPANESYERAVLFSRTQEESQKNLQEESQRQSIAPVVRA